MRDAQAEEIAGMLEGTPLVVMLDIDGTLCNIVERPEEAFISEAARTALGSLVAAPGVHVALVTGRSASDARAMVRIAGVAIYGNHGLERLSADGNITTAPVSKETERALRGAATQLARTVDEFPGTSLEDKHFSLTLHFRGMNTAFVPNLKSRVSEIAEDSSLRVSPGKCVINVLPALGATKGDAVQEIVREAGGGAAGGAALFVGDDVTDEDAFRELEPAARAITVRVGPAVTSSAAKFALRDPDEVVRLLTLLAESRT